MFSSPHGTYARQITTCAIKSSTNLKEFKPYRICDFCLQWNQIKNKLKKKKKEIRGEFPNTRNINTIKKKIIYESKTNATENSKDKLN